MRFGLRFSLLLLLGALMLVSFLPLFFATSTYTRLGLERLQRENAIKLGRSVTSHLAAVRTQSSSEEAFLEFSRTQIAAESVHALSILAPSGKPRVVLGDPDLVQTIFAEPRFDEESEIRELSTERGPAVLVYQSTHRGGVAAVVRVDAEVTRATKLSALMGLYMGVGGLAMLVVAYFALTRWIVRPILVLEHGAERVASGARRLAPIDDAPRELANLSRRLSQMTAKLRDEEESLRSKIEEVEARTEELRLTQQSLMHSERLATVGRLAAGLAHEVGNPISALMGLLDLMLTGELTPEERKDFLQRMHRETVRIDRVLSDLLAYARSGKKRACSSWSPSEVEPAIDDVLSLLAPQRDFSNVALEKAVGGRLPLVGLTREELTQVLLNLMMNAADALDHEGHVLVSATAISFGNREEGRPGVIPKTQGVQLCVEDDGPGISAEVQETLFEPFVTTKDVGKGTGLGLSVTKGLVEGAGGRIWAENRQPRGARLVIELPAVGSDFRGQAMDC